MPTLESKLRMRRRTSTPSISGIRGVEQNHVGLLQVELGEGLDPTMGRDDLVPPLGQVLGQHLRHRHLVVHDEDLAVAFVHRAVPFARATVDWGVAPHSPHTSTAVILTDPSDDSILFSFTSIMSRADIVATSPRRCPVPRLNF